MSPSSTYSRLLTPFKLVSRQLTLIDLLVALTSDQVRAAQDYYGGFDSLRMAAALCLEPVATSWRLNRAVACATTVDVPAARARAAHGGGLGHHRKKTTPGRGQTGRTSRLAVEPRGGLQLLAALVGDPEASERARAAAADAMCTICNVNYDQHLANRIAARDAGAIGALVRLAHAEGCRGAEPGGRATGVGVEPEVGGQWEVRRWALGAEQVQLGQCRLAALRALGVLVGMDDRNKEALRRQGGIPVMVAMAGASVSTEESRDYAVLSLSLLCTAAAQDEMRNEGAIVALVRHRIAVAPRPADRDGSGDDANTIGDYPGTNGVTPSPGSRTWAVQCLTRICKDPHDKMGLLGHPVNQARAREEGAFEALVGVLKPPGSGFPPHEPLQLAAVACLRMLLSQNEVRSSAAVAAAAAAAAASYALYDSQLTPSFLPSSLLCLPALD